MTTPNSDGEAAAGDKAARGLTVKERWDAGAKLFKELYRRFPRANHEDYYRMGVWSTQVLEIDIELLDQHRQEASAPELPTLEDIPDSVLPPAPVRRTEPSARPGPGAPSAGRPMRPTPPGNAPEDPRRLQDFVDRWRLDPMRVKLMFGRFRPDQRAYVMQNFQPTSSDKKQATNQLRDYLDDQSRLGWPRLHGRGEFRRPMHGAPATAAASRRQGSVIGAGASGRPAPTSRSATAPPPRIPASRYGAPIRRGNPNDGASRREPPWAARGDNARARPPGGQAPSGTKRPAPTAIGAAGGAGAKRSRYGDNMPAPASQSSSLRPAPPSRAPPPSARPRTPPRSSKPGPGPPKPPPGAPPSRRAAGTAGSGSASTSRSERRGSVPSSVVAAKPGDLIKSLLG